MDPSPKTIKKSFVLLRYNEIRELQQQYFFKPTVQRNDAKEVTSPLPNENPCMHKVLF